MPDLTLSLEDFDAWHKENPYSRFSGPASEKLWESSILSGQDEDLGDSEGFGWYALFVFGSEDEAGKFACSGMAGAILYQGSSGHVCCDTYGARDILDKAWSALEAAYAEFTGDEVAEDF